VSDETTTTEPDPTAQTDEVEPIVVPDVSQAKLLEWVGDDIAPPTRAAAAHAHELSKDKPRAVVVKALEELLGLNGDAPAEVEYFATEDFSTQVEHSFVSFKAGAKIDSLAALAIIAAGGPVEARPA
jgi:hypothetical protein